MEVCKFYPVANERMGALWTLASIKDACIIEFGPAGTTHYALEGIGSLNANEVARIYSTHLDQDDVTFGKYDRLEKAILELDENLAPRYLFVMASSISAIIGADIESVCTELASQVRAKLIPITTSGLKHHYPVGVAEVLELLVEQVVKPGTTNLNQYNILGMTIDRYNFLADVKELQRMMKGLFGKDVNTVFTCETTIAAIEGATAASLNIVVRQEALEAAKYLEKVHGIPFVYANLYGVKNIQAFVETVSQIAGYELNEEFLKQELATIAGPQMSVRRTFFLSKTNLACAIFGDYDTVCGLRDCLLELGLEVDRAEVLYKMAVAKPLIAGQTEADRMKYLKERDLLFLLGDGACEKMENRAKGYLQVSNPNFDRRLIYPDTPFIGFKGVLWLIQQILNITLD